MSAPESLGHPFSYKRDRYTGSLLIHTVLTVTTAEGLVNALHPTLTHEMVQKNMAALTTMIEPHLHSMLVRGCSTDPKNPNRTASAVRRARVVCRRSERGPPNRSRAFMQEIPVYVTTQ
jgi:hypothetical protein